MVAGFRFNGKTARKKRRQAENTTVWRDLLFERIALGDQFLEGFHYWQVLLSFDKVVTLPKLILGSVR